MSNDGWISWHGGDWDGDPEKLVHVRFQDGTDDSHMPPTPAGNLGLAGEPSNWRRSGRDLNSVIAYRPVTAQPMRGEEP